MADRDRKGSRSGKGESGGNQVWMCEKCKKEFKHEGCKMLECERCMLHFCTKCIKISDQGYEFMSERADIHWFCGGCDTKVVQSIAIDREIQKRCEDFFRDLSVKMNKFEEKVNDKLKDTVGRAEMDVALSQLKTNFDRSHEKMEGEIEKVLVAVNEIRESVKTKVDADELQVTYAEMAVKQVNDSLGVAAEEVKGIGKAIQEVKVARQEEEDKESRKNNIIMYRVPESAATAASDRNADDYRFCSQLLYSLQVGIAQEDIRKVFRLGRRVEEADSQRGPRPLLIQLGSRGAKNLITESLYKLKSMESKFKSVIIAHDMTKSERDECKDCLLYTSPSPRDGLLSRMPSSA